MNESPELIHFLGFLVFTALVFVGGVSWGRKNPNKVEELNKKLKALEDKLKS